MAPQRRRDPFGVLEVHVMAPTHPLDAQRLDARTAHFHTFVVVLPPLIGHDDQGGRRNALEKGVHLSFVEGVW